MKKWRIDIVQRSLEITLQRYESERALTKSLTDSVENTITTWRNAVLAAVSLAASIILGLSSVDLFKEYVLQILVADVLIGLVAFIVFTVIKGKVHGLILSMDGAYYILLSAVNSLRFGIMHRMFTIDELEDERIRFLFEYSDLASNQVRVHLIYALENISSSVFFRKIRSNIRGSLEAQKGAVSKANATYEEKKSTWGMYIQDLIEFDGYLGI